MLDSFPITQILQFSLMEVLDVVLLEDVPRVLASGVLLGVVSGREHKMYLMARLEVGI